MELEYAQEHPEEIMIVDDVEANRVILSGMIESMGWTAVPAQSAAEALELLKTRLPQLFLLDITMPDMDGFELCGLLKEQPSTRDIPVIFISASTGTEDKVRGFQLGGVDYISKPFVLPEVTARLSSHLHLYEMQRQMEVYNKRLNRMISEQALRIEEEKKKVLYALTKITESSVNVDSGHMEAMKANCRKLAQAMQFSPVFESRISASFIDTIEVTAPLHDIGRITIPESVLSKATALDDKEMNLIRKHTLAGARILSEIYTDTEENEFIRMAIEIARSHHEKWDGSGYPDGLSQKAIPLSAQIVSVISIYSALREERHYRRAYSAEESMEIMQTEVGSTFDPELFDVFYRIRNQIRL